MDTTLTSLEATLLSAMQIDGALGVALADYTSGMSLASTGGGATLNLEVAAAGNSEVIRAKLRVMGDLRLKEQIEDILITLESQYHLIRILRSSQTLFLYLALDRKKSNLALARHKLAAIEQNLTV